MLRVTSLEKILQTPDAPSTLLRSQNLQIQMGDVLYRSQS